MARLRQPFLATLLVSVALCVSRGDPANPEATQELRAAELLEASVMQRGATETDCAKLVSLFDRLVAKYPGDAAIRNARAELLWVRGAEEKAKSDWLDAERMDGRNGEVLNHLGGCAMEEGRVQDSAGYYRRAVEAAPNSAVYHYNLANVLFMFRKELPSSIEPAPDKMIQDALRHYAEAARLAPLSEEYLRGYGEAFLLLPTPDWRGALDAWERLARIAIRKDFAMANLARIHLKLGEKAKALECLATIQSPEFSALKAKLAAEAARE